MKEETVLSCKYHLAYSVKKHPETPYKCERCGMYIALSDYEKYLLGVKFMGKEKNGEVSESKR